MEYDDDYSSISYNRFSVPKKQVIQHKHTDSDSNSITSFNSVKPTKSIVSSPGSYSASYPKASSLGSPKRENSLNSYSSKSNHMNMTEYQYMMSSQNQHQYNQQYQQQQKQKKFLKQSHDLNYQYQKHQEEIQRNLQYYQQRGQFTKRDKDSMPRYNSDQGMKMEKTNMNPNKHSDQLSLHNYPVSMTLTKPMAVKSISATVTSVPDITSSMAYMSVNDRSIENKVSYSNNGSPVKMTPFSNENINNRKSNRKPSVSNNDYFYINNSNSEYSETESDNESRRGLILNNDNIKKSNSNKNDGKLNKKLEYIMENPSLDVSVSDILNYGLKAMIQSKVPLCYFLYTLIEDYCCENLFFYLEIKQYKSFVFENISAQHKAAIYIYVTYLDSSSKIEVNIEEKIRRDILNQLNSNQCNLVTIFDKAMESVFSLMESSFSKFNRSNIKKRMIDELDNTNEYNDEYKINAIKLLTSYLYKRKKELEIDAEYLNMNNNNSGKGDKNRFNSLTKQQQQQPPQNETTPEQLLHQSIVQRHQMICALTHEFIRAFLELDFDDESEPLEVTVFKPPIQYIQNINEDPYKVLPKTVKKKQRQEIQVSIQTDSHGQQFQVVTTPAQILQTYNIENNQEITNDKKNKKKKKNKKN